MPEPHTSDVVTTAEACAILGGINRSTLTRWVKAGKLEPLAKVGGVRGAYVFARADIEALAAARGGAA